MKNKIFICVLLFLVPAGAMVHAQSEPALAIVGRAADAEGAPLPGVSVEAAGPKLMGRMTAVTAADGSYRLAPLPAGVYE
ncbi:MAG: carboxypeptidase-like regulatory domain-containing protein, partial [Acidobacteriota bacterium]